MTLNQISLNTNAGMQMNTPAPMKQKEDARKVQDTVTRSWQQPEIHSLKDYGKNLAHSIKGGAAGAAIRTGEFVNQFMPSYDGLDHFGMHLLCAMPPIIAGAIGGVFGAGVGLAMGVVGKNATPVFFKPDELR